LPSADESSGFEEEAEEWRSTSPSGESQETDFVENVEQPESHDNDLHDSPDGKD
jgi:hypothetical protein